MRNYDTVTTASLFAGAIIFAAFAVLIVGCGAAAPTEQIILPDGTQAPAAQGEGVDLINVFEEVDEAPVQAALPVPEADYTCPKGARYATDGAGRAFCLFEGLQLPKGDDLTAQCQYLNLNYIGFAWTAGGASAGYACPEHSTRAVNDAGQQMCLFDKLQLPMADGLRPECFFLE